MKARDFFKRARALSAIHVWEKSRWRLLKKGRQLRYRSRFQHADGCSVEKMIRPTLHIPTSADGLYRYILENPRPRFFFGYASRDQVVSQAQAWDACGVMKTVEEAEGVVHNRFYVHGFGETVFENDIRWWGSTQPYRDKLLSRHDFIPTLIQAYWYTGRVRFAERAITLWRHWIDYSDRLKLDNSVDNSMRVQNWLWMLYGVPLRELLEPTDVIKLLSDVYRSGHYIEANMLYAGNHRIIEALGLWFIGVFFPELRQSDHWRSKGGRILVEEIGRQVTADGVHMEMSSAYHVFVTTHLLKFYILSTINKYSVPEQFVNRLRKMLKFVETLRKPDGQIPMLGDSDSLNTRDREHREAKLLRPALSLVEAGTITMDPSTEDLIPWYLGDLPQRPKGGEAVSETENNYARSKWFPSAGYAVMRSGCGRKGHYMFIDAGPLGLESLGHHGHADALHVEICTSGKSLVIDPGGYGYVDDRWRHYFRSTRAHSTVEVDGKNQSEIFGTFGTGRTAECKITSWLTNERMDFVEAIHDGYQMLSPPVVHRRAILFMKDSLPYWIILDRLEGEGEHTLNLLFHLTPEAQCHVQGPDEVIVRLSKACSTLIRSINFPPDRFTLVAGQTEPEIQGWVSRTTGSREQAPVVSFNKKASLPQTFVTLVQPEYAHDRIVSVRRHARAISDGIECGWELAWLDVIDRIYIGQAVKNRHHARLAVSVERSRAGKPIWHEPAGHHGNRFLHS